MRRLSLFVTLIAPALASAQGAVDLLCTASVDGRPALVTVLKLDYAGQKVNGIPALFGSTEITWVTAKIDQGRVAYDDHTLNRVASTYRFGTRGAIYASMPPLYSCIKAPPPQF